MLGLLSWYQMIPCNLTLSQSQPFPQQAGSRKKRSKDLAWVEDAVRGIGSAGGFDATSPEFGLIFLSLLARGLPAGLGGL